MFKKMLNASKITTNKKKNLVRMYKSAKKKAAKMFTVIVDGTGGADKKNIEKKTENLHAFIIFGQNCSVK